MIGGLRLGLVLGWMALAAQAFAHSDLHDRIAELDVEIAGQPDDGTLYLRRGEFHRQHGSWTKAEADFAAAADRLDEPRVVDYHLGRLWLEAGHPGKAFDALDRFLTFRPGEPNGLVLRGRARAALDEPLSAAADLSDAIARIDQPTPDLYLERAKLFAAAGPAHIPTALAGLDDAAARFGSVVTIVQLAIDLENRRDNDAGALAWLERLPDALQTTPVWLAKRGDILASGGTFGEAHRQYRAALEAMAGLPASRRNTPAQRQLTLDICDRMNAVAVDLDKAETDAHRLCPD